MNLEFKLGIAYLNIDCSRLSEIHLNNGFHTKVGQALYKEFISIVFFTIKSCQMRGVSIQHTDIDMDITVSLVQSPFQT